MFVSESKCSLFVRQRREWMIPKLIVKWNYLVTTFFLRFKFAWQFWEFWTILIFQVDLRKLKKKTVKKKLPNCTLIIKCFNMFLHFKFYTSGKRGQACLTSPTLFFNFKFIYKCITIISLGNLIMIIFR